MVDLPDHQTLKRIEVFDKTFSKPPINRNHIRLYGHYLCPFVEITRLVLAFKQIPYQDCQVSLLSRTKWHYKLNNGFVPILELPSGDHIYESDVISTYLDQAYPTD